MITVSSKLKRLVDKKLEGMLSSDERQELDRLLADSDQARVYLLQMETLHQSLVEAGQSRQEPDLSDAVMHQLAQESSKDSRIIRLNSRLRNYNSQLTRYAAVLLVGLLVGSVVTFLLLPGRTTLRTEDVSATMSARSGQTLTLEQDIWRIQLQPVIAADMVIIITSVSSADDLNMNMLFNPNIFRLESTRFLSYDVMPEARSQTGNLNVQLNGDMVMQFVFKRQPGMSEPISVEVMQNDAIVYKSEIVIQ